VLNWLFSLNIGRFREHQRRLILCNEINWDERIISWLTPKQKWRMNLNKGKQLAKPRMSHLKWKFIIYALYIVTMHLAKY